VKDNLRDGSAHWPRVPDPIHPPDQTREFPDGSGPGTTTLLVLIVLVILIAATYLALITNAGGGAR
jgi:hypothetical protein